MAINVLENRRRMIAAQPHLETVSGAVATFIGERFPLKSCKATINPVQDLHGYENPWPGGGGENVLDPNLKFTAGTYFGGAVLSTQDGYNISFSGTPTESGNITTNLIATADAVVMPAGTYTSVGGIFSTYKPDGSWYTNRRTGTWTADSDFIVRQIYIQAVANTPMSGSWFICLVKGTTAPTAWTPYSNICPITGWTGAKVTRTGKNIWDEEWEVGAISDTTGQKVYGVNRIRSKNYIPVLPNTQYNFAFPSSASVSSGNLRIMFYNENKSYLSFRNWITTGPFTTPSDTKYILFYTNGTYGGTYHNDISINYPATDTQYHPYQGETYDITFPTEAGAVYGGTLDVTTGVLTVDRAFIAYDGSGDESWTYYDPDNYDSYCFVIAITNKKIKSSSSICNEYKNIGGVWSSGWNGKFGVYSDHVTLRRCYFARPNANFEKSVSAWREWLSNNPLQLVYELAAPVTYQLTPQEITTLIGTNNIWANTGDITVTRWTH